MPIDWSQIKTRSMRDAFRRALSDDKQLSHSECVDALRSALDDGQLSFEEISDLNNVAKNSETISPRSKQMLLNLAYEGFLLRKYGSITFSTNRQKYAAEILCDFLKRTGSRYFKKLDRDRVGIDLLLRVANPNIINQQHTTTCGPTSFLYSLAFDSPGAYAKFGIDLFEKGKASIGLLEIEPSSDCRNYFPGTAISHGEWLTTASLRDSENWFFDYDSAGASGDASSFELAKWFRRSGYTDVHNDDNVTMNRDSGDISLMNYYYNGGYRVVLRINSMLLHAETQAKKSYRGNHFIVLRSPITVAGRTVRLTVYTWGQGQRSIPEAGTELSPSAFLGHWYGYVAARPF